MAMHFEELDERTRAFMLAEFDTEQSGATPYRSRNLTDAAQEPALRLIHTALEDGTEETLAHALAVPTFWHPMQSYVRGGQQHWREVNYVQAAEMLAVTEFNTWYVRGFTRRLMDEGVAICEVYRAREPKWTPGPCAQHEGQVYAVGLIYNGHRARYWPEPGDPNAFSIPYGPHCHHTIRRVR